MRRILAPLLALVLVGCGDGPKPAAVGPLAPTAGRLRVGASCEPVRFLAARIAGDAAEVFCPLPDDADPAHWNPDPAAVERLQRADVIFVNGAKYERWLNAVNLPRSRIVDTTARLSEPFVKRAHALVHSHGGGKPHEHARIDGHTWVDPKVAQEQAAAIRDALLERLPAAAGGIRERFDALAAELETLHGAFAALGSLPEGRALVAAQPAYGYLARRHGWTLIELDIDPERAPDPEKLREMMGRLDGVDARHLLWPLSPRAKVSGSFGLTSLVVPIGDRPAVGRDLLATLRQAVTALGPAFE